jgi:hypothetical protein
MGNKKELVIHRKELTIISSVSLIRNERGDFFASYNFLFLYVMGKRLLYRIGVDIIADADVAFVVNIL